MTLGKGQNGKNPKAEPIAPAKGRLFKARGAAQYLGVRESFVRSLIARGELVVLRTSAGRLIGIYEADCNAWLEQHRTVAEPVTVRPSIDDRIAQMMPAERRFQ